MSFRETYVHRESKCYRTRLCKLSKLALQAGICVLRTDSCCTHAVQLVLNLGTFQNADDEP